MTKKEFENYIYQQMHFFTIDEQVKLLEKIKNEWIPDLINKKTKNYSKCPICKKYALKKRFKKRSFYVVKEDVLVFSDAGYGDDDEYADVKYLVTYATCPLCGKETEVSSQYIEKIIKKGLS